jgi:hypothetical protein
LRNLLGIAFISNSSEKLILRPLTPTTPDILFMSVLRQGEREEDGGKKMEGASKLIFLRINYQGRGESVETFFVDTGGRGFLERAVGRLFEERGPLGRTLPVQTPQSCVVHISLQWGPLTPVVSLYTCAIWLAPAYVFLSGLST